MDKNDSLHYLLIAPQSESYQPHRTLITTILREIGIESVSLEERKWTPGELVTQSLMQEVKERLIKGIEQADFIIADLTGSDPNVMYNVGFAHALRKPLLLIVQSQESRIPASLGGHYFLVYDPSEPDELRASLQRWVGRLVVEAEKERA